MGESDDLRGTAPAKIDDKGRLKIPNGFRGPVQQQYGRRVYVTSLSGESVLIYPMPVWCEIEDKLKRMPSTLPARRNFLDHVAYYGQTAEIDGQGRVLIHGRLRESALMIGEVDVVGKINYLEVWNHERLDTKIKSEPFSDEYANQLAEYGI